MVLSMSSRQSIRMLTHSVSVPALKDQIEATLDADPDRPWCVHRLYEELVATAIPGGREDMLVLTQTAADDLVMEGRAHREFVSAVGIGVHCEDSLYWSPESEKRTLADFGPEYESPRILRRLGSHFQCHGL
jgi:hypothetical protein